MTHETDVLRQQLEVRELRRIHRMGMRTEHERELRAIGLGSLMLGVICGAFWGSIITWAVMR